MDTRLVTVILVLAFVALAYGNTESPESSPPDAPVQESWDTDRLRECIDDLFADIEIGEVYNTVARMIDVEAYDRLEEARSHYKDEQFVATKLGPMPKSCEKIRNEIDVSALIPATKQCFSHVGKDAKDKEAIQILVEESFFFQFLLEIYYGCEHGGKTEEFWREFGLSELILSKPMLRILKDEREEREECLNELVKAFSLAYDEGKEFVDDAVKERIKEARKFYGRPGESSEQPKPEPLPNCEKIEKVTDKALAAYDNCFGMGVVGWHGLSNLYYLTKRLDDRGKDIVEAETACEWGPKSAGTFEEFTILSLMADPKRVPSW